jgi:hypothetical protein
MMERATTDGRPETQTGHPRVLVVATEELIGDELGEVLSEHAAGRRAQIRIISPAVTDSPLKHAFGDVDEAIASAEQRLERSLEEVRRRGIEVSGAVGDADPLVAIEDALAGFEADEILLVTHPDGDAAWLEGDVFERARRELALPITHVTLERRGAGGAGVVDVEESGGTVEEPEAGGGSGNIPSLTWRDLGGILVAIFGTIVLVVLAADCADASDPGCIVRYLVAGGLALLNIAHVVGLLLFESVGYRGLWEKFFANLSLFGTPAGIVISLLVH